VWVVYIDLLFVVEWFFYWLASWVMMCRLCFCLLFFDVSCCWGWNVLWFCIFSMICVLLLRSRRLIGDCLCIIVLVISLLVMRMMSCTIFGVMF